MMFVALGVIGVICIIVKLIKMNKHHVTDELYEVIEETPHELNIETVE